MYVGEFSVLFYSFLLGFVNRGRAEERGRGVAALGAYARTGGNHLYKGEERSLGDRARSFAEVPVPDWFGLDRKAYVAAFFALDSLRIELNRARSTYFLRDHRL